MIDRKAAEAIAARNPSSYKLSRQGSRELALGWFFAYKPRDEFGARAGVVVNKATGKCREMPFKSLDRHLTLYDKGYCSKAFDLVVLAVHDQDVAINGLPHIGMTVVEPTYEHGVVWRVPRPMARAELHTRLARLPAVFERLSCSSHAEAVEALRSTGAVDVRIVDAAT